MIIPIIALSKWTYILVGVAVVLIVVALILKSRSK